METGHDVIGVVQIGRFELPSKVPNWSSLESKS